MRLIQKIVSHNVHPANSVVLPQEGAKIVTLVARPVLVNLSTNVYLVIDNLITIYVNQIIAYKPQGKLRRKRKKINKFSIL